MSLDDWLLALHLLAAVALAGAIFGFWALIVSARRADRPGDLLRVLRVFPVLGAVAAIGSVATIIFGVWLAFSLDAYEIWDGWIIAAIVLWAIGTGAGERSGREYARVAERAGQLGDSAATGAEVRALARSPQALMLHVVASVAVLLLLIDMIWKPGA